MFFFDKRVFGAVVLRGGFFCDGDGVTAAASFFVEAEVQDDTAEPGCEFGGGFVFRGGLPDSEECFLGDVFGGVPVGEGAPCEGEDSFVVAQEELAEGRSAALGESCHELHIRE